ncbi:acyl--CoA ligase [Faecalicatena sp. AGMB00832]|uniref:Acyl--CoA ligase n=1 Tax=Faecalicatena faecalis TaxID=2726362 RepID=A0ABS6D7T1_9FIRM|nr:class I adenylate-forming enzyme family protein [Faecalicatena faecalis]MBU3877650.1 acyl--CoA ligase [Faecalicatena faecalis]
MIDGNLLWDKSLTNDLIQVQFQGSPMITTFPGLPDNLYMALKRTASYYPEKIALSDNYGREYTYQNFQQRCEELSAYLYFRKGIRKGSHVGLMMYNCVEFCVSFLALSRLGAVTVPLPSKFKEKEVLSLAKRAEVELVICDEQYEAWFQGVYQPEAVMTVRKVEEQYGFLDLYREWDAQPLLKAQDISGLDGVETGSPKDAAIIMFTSGTTSESKGVLLRNYNIMHAVEAYRRTLGITKEDISVIATPIYHITGLVALLGLFLHTGGTLYLHKFFDASRVIREAREKGFTFIHASPTVFNLLIQEGENTPPIPSLKSFACGSSNMNKSKLRQLHKWLPDSKFHTVYGLTETSSPATVFPGDAATSTHIGASGIPIPGTKFMILDEDGKELPTGEVGEIVVKGSVVLDSYYKQKSQSLKDGWLYTGDLGYFTEDSYLFVVDRKKNMINRGGEKIWCFDVENELTSMEEIQDAAVVGIPDELYGEVAAAVVQLRTGSEVTPEMIKEYLAGRIAKYKIPVKIKLVDRVPQTANGKTDKNTIKKLLMEDET